MQERAQSLKTIMRTKAGILSEPLENLNFSAFSSCMHTCVHDTIGAIDGVLSTNAWDDGIADTNSKRIRNFQESTNFIHLKVF